MSDDKQPSVDHAELLRAVSADKFAEIFASASRAARAALAKRFGIKKPPAFGAGALKERRDEHARRIQEAFLEEGDARLSEELIRAWLFTRRPLLGAALDYMKIPHNNGLTDEDLTAFEQLGAKAARQLQEHLAATFPAEDVFVYLRFVGVKHVERPA